MTWSAPLMLAGLILLIPILIAFLVKRRRAVVVVPSTVLWRSAGQRRVKNEKLRHLLRILGLLACLLGVASVIMAAASPQPSAASTTTAIVVDVSASMGDGGARTPFAEARRIVSKQLWSRGRQETITLIAAGTRPLLLAGPTTDGAVLRAAERALTPQRGAADIAAALELAEGLLAHQPNPRIILIHDGGQPHGADPRTVLRRGVPLLERRLGDEGADNRDNVGIVTLTSRRPTDAQSADSRELLLSLATSSDRERQVVVDVQAFGLSLVRHELDIPARGELETRLRVETTADALSLRVTPTDGIADALAIDDELSVSLGVTAPERVLLVTPEDAPASETFFITRALRSAGVSEIIEATPEEIPEDLDPHDVVVITSRAPAHRPNAPTLYLGTENVAELLPLTNQRELLARPSDDEATEGETSRATPTRLHSVIGRHPLLAGVDLEGITADRALAVSPPPGSRALVELEGGTVVVAGGDGREGWVYVGFDPSHSDLVLRVAFPVLVSNALALLGGATQVTIADAVPRSEVQLQQGPVLEPTGESTTRLPLPRSPSLWLALAGALLLALEAMFWKRGWSR